LQKEIEMFSRTLALMLSAFVVVGTIGLHAVKAQTPDRNQAAEKVRIQVTKIGLGPKARIEVKLHDDSQLKGYISAVNQDSFTLTDSKTGATQNVNYGEVAQIKKSGGGLSTRSWIIIGGAGAAAAIVGFTVVKPVLCDGGAGC